MSYQDRKPRANSNNRNFQERGSFNSGNNSSRGSNQGQKSYQNNGGGNGGGEQKYKWTRLGDLMIPRSRDDDKVLSDAVGTLIENQSTLNFKIYLGPDPDATFQLRNGDYALVSFRLSDKDPDYVVGKVLMSNEG